LGMDERDPVALQAVLDEPGDRTVHRGLVAPAVRPIVDLHGVVDGRLRGHRSYRPARIFGSGGRPRPRPTRKCSNQARTWTRFSTRRNGVPERVSSWV